MEEIDDPDTVQQSASVQAVDEESCASFKNCRVNVLELSDEILLVILKNLDSPSLYNLSNTCERFRNLVKEKKLWTTFDFQQEKLTAMELLRRMHFLNQETKSFRIRGLTSNYPFSSWDNPTITGNMLTMLKDSCPHLETLSVVEGFINFNKINIQNFPPSLVRLELNKCEVPKPKMPQMFFHRIDTHMARLEELCLEDSYWFETHDLVLFSKMPELRVLNLNGSSSMTHCVPYASIASRYGFKKLEVLDLRNTPVSDSDIQCFNITSTLKELLLECPRNLRDDVRIPNQPSSSGTTTATRKRRTSHHSLQQRLQRGKKRPASDTEGSSDRPQESTENDDEDSSSDSCTRTRAVKSRRTGRDTTNEVISITMCCDRTGREGGAGAGGAGGSRNVVHFPFRIDGRPVVQPPSVSNGAASSSSSAANLASNPAGASSASDPVQLPVELPGPSIPVAGSSSSTPSASSITISQGQSLQSNNQTADDPAEGPSSSSSSSFAPPTSSNTDNPNTATPSPSSSNAPTNPAAFSAVVIEGAPPSPPNPNLQANPLPMALAPPNPIQIINNHAHNNMIPRVELRQNGQSVRMNPIVIHNNNALGPIIIISGPPPSHRTVRQMRIQVFRRKKKKHAKNCATKRRTSKGSGAAEGASNRGNPEDSVEGDDEEDEDGMSEDDDSDDDEYESEGEGDEDGDEGEGESYRPGFYTPSAMNLISDRGICSFGVSPNNVMPNWIWIRAEAKNPNTNIERMVLRNYRQVTDMSLQHLKTCAPKLVYLDVSGTSVTKEAVEQFRIEKVDCEVIADV